MKRKKGGADVEMSIYERARRGDFTGGLSPEVYMAHYLDSKEAEANRQLEWVRALRAIWQQGAPVKPPRDLVPMHVLLKREAAQEKHRERQVEGLREAGATAEMEQWLGGGDAAPEVPQ